MFGRQSGRMRTLGIIAAVVVCGLVLAWMALQPHTYRYRLTIEIMTPDGLRSGSSVLEVLSSETTVGLIEMRGVRSALRGEAVFVDLGQGRNVVALLGGGPDASDEDTMFRMPVIAFGLEKLSWEQQQKALAGSLTGKSADVPDGALPTLVTFSNVSDPTTARVVAPSDLQSAFGPGIRFNRAWIEMTKDTVTRGIEKNLPFLVTFREWMRHQLSYPDKFTPHFHLFSRE
jgi:hypothetical protein